MARNRKCYIHDKLYEICFRTEEGLPLVATAYMRTLIEGTLARAQTLYPVTICHLLTMPNHMHVLMVVENPAQVPLFYGYVKREISHAINRFCGRRVHTVWCEGYDSPIVLDFEKALQRIEYIYTNPTKADLVDSIDEYPNVHSWQWFLEDGAELQRRKPHRDAIPELPNRPLSFREQNDIARLLQDKDNSHPPDTLRIEPHAWMRCFEETRRMSPTAMKEKIIERVREAEEIHRRRRAKEQKKVIGVRALRCADIRQQYIPEKRGKRMICLSTLRELRIQFIEWFKERSKEAYDFVKLWRKGVRDCIPPPGFFLPGGSLLANAVPYTIPGL